uniref:Uncharacterized protein n=1 Tax=Rhizophora mucronata TaxID=61149 RepID=A0A2P2L865_RHIMU
MRSALTLASGRVVLLSLWFSVDLDRVYFLY